MDVHAEPPASADPRASLPQIPGGRYHIVERLSTGAIGAVYKALDTILDRPVAVKCIHLDTPFAEQSPDELRERFVREARIAARLQHPNIVTIHDIVATDHRGFIIMEFIEGDSFESLLSSRGRLPLPEAVRVISQLASALDYAHARNVVHRDVKPANIVISPSLWVWITDFGIAKSELSTNLTMAGGVLGTPDYMSPEQAKGEDVDARSDLFSLGCILFECVTGEKPFRSPSLTGVLLSIINDEPVFPLNWKSLGLPNGLKPILHHALEKDRRNRYSSGAELVKALEDLRSPAESFVLSATTPAPVAPPPSPMPQAPEPAPAAAVATGGEAPGEPELPREPVEEAPAHPSAEAASEPQPESPSPPPAEPAIEEAPEAAEAKEPEAVDERTMVFNVADARPPEPPNAPVIDVERVRALKEDARPLRLSPSLSGDLQRAVISPEEGFLLSRIDGQSRASDILAMSPMPEAETAAALLNLLDKELILVGGPPPKSAAEPPPAPSVPASALPPRGVPDEATLRELDRLLDLAKNDEYAELLGIAPDAPSAKRKSAYLKIVGKYHPDKFPRATDDIRDKLSRLCAEAADAVDELEKPKEKPNGSRPGGFSGAATTFSSDGTSAEKRRRHARELYDRALRAFDAQDFWEAIQLCRQALEVDDSQADYFHLLGRALMQNKMWRREAADNFRKASELDPHNVNYLGMLGAIYKAEGLTARANSVLKKAQLIDPAYTLPEIDGQVTVEAE
jgi:serine/threonine protein kinase